MPEIGTGFREYAKLAKQEIRNTGDTNEVSRGAEALKVEFASRHSNSKETQEAIYKIELQKQQILAQTKRDLTELRKSERWTKNYPNARPITNDELRGGLVLTNDRNQTLTEGEILTDGEWEAVYNLDASVPRELRYKYIVEAARRQLRELLDEQIALDKGGSVAVDSGKRKAYLAREQEPDETHAGLIAEKLVRNMLKKISIDLNADFSIEETNLQQDVEHKIDFIIHRKSHHRGVGVASGKQITDIGVQFTMDGSVEKATHKTKQINRVKATLGKDAQVSDIVLVQIPLRHVLETLKEWKKQKRPGGPDKLWDRAKREKIVRGVLDRIMPPKEIDQLCARLAS